MFQGQKWDEEKEEMQDCSSVRGDDNIPMILGHFNNVYWFRVNYI